MKNWEMKRADSEEEAEKLLAEGWEPFSIDFTVINGIIATKYMWFKRRRNAKKRETRFPNTGT